VIPSGSPRNPGGGRGIDAQPGQYAIHGTNSPGSIGSFVSHGCIHLFNADVMDLYKLGVGTQMVVLQ
jgi:lipoprotein-anchoring transpeptidase ErfK/SrfK